MKDEALRMALEALEWISNLETGRFIRQKATEPIAAIKQALAAPVQEPVATLFGSLPVYDTTPPAAQRQWVGLTDDERTEIRREHYARTLPLMDAIEAKLRSKNT